MSGRIHIVVVSGTHERLQMAAMMASVGAVSGNDVRAAFLFQGEMAVVQSHLRKGRPVVVAVRSRSAGPFHYIVLVGFDDASSVVLANDPQRGRLVRIPYKKFLVEWQRSRQWSLLAVPK